MSKNMEYRKHRIEYLRTTVEYSLFGGEGGTREAHLMFHVDPEAGSYEEQLTAIRKAYHRILSRKVKIRGMVPVFCRYFLRNAAYKHYWTAGAGVSCGKSERQMKTLLKSYEADLVGKGCTLASDCIRTWIFVQNVDVNYAGIVKARRENFLGQGLTESTHYIASTGIEGRHADPKIHVLFDAYAVKGLQPGQVTYLHALSHLSPTALYGVTFERGTSVEYGDRRHLFISGTASIDHRGEVVHVGDVREQTRRMWENVEKLLEEGKAGFEDVAQMIVYLRDASDYPVVRALFAKRFPDTPIQFVVAAVCRPAWLIEMECIAIVANSNSSYESF